MSTIILGCVYCDHVKYGQTDLTMDDFRREIKENEPEGTIFMIDTDHLLLVNVPITGDDPAHLKFLIMVPNEHTETIERDAEAIEERNARLSPVMELMRVLGGANIIGNPIIN